MSMKQLLFMSIIIKFWVQSDNSRIICPSMRTRVRYEYWFAKNLMLLGALVVLDKIYFAFWRSTRSICFNFTLRRTISSGLTMCTQHTPSKHKKKYISLHINPALSGVMRNEANSEIACIGGKRQIQTSVLGKEHHESVTFRHLWKWWQTDGPTKWKSNKAATRVH